MSAFDGKNLETPELGPDWQFRFQLQLLFPKYLEQSGDTRTCQKIHLLMENHPKSHRRS